MEITVRRLNFLSKLATCKSNVINQLLNIKDDLINVTKPFNFVVNEHGNQWHNLMWNYFTSVQDN